MRGPAFAPATSPGELAPGGVPAGRRAGQRFDRVAMAVMADLWKRWPDQLGGVQLGVEEVPLIPDHWAEDSVPLSSYVEATPTEPARLVLLRRPIEHRAESLADQDALVLAVLVEQVAEILGIPPEKVHPGYDEED